MNVWRGVINDRNEQAINVSRMVDAHKLYEQAKRFDDAGKTLSAANIYETLLNEHPDNFRYLVKYSQAIANHDRQKSINAIEAFIQRLPEEEYEGRARCLEIQLPYLESERRKDAGLDSYSSESLYEFAFPLSAAELANYGRNLNFWENADTPTYWTSVAYFYNAMQNWPAVDRVLSLLRTFGEDPRDYTSRFTHNPNPGMMIGGTVNFHHECKAEKPHVLTACDPNYWEAYGERLMRSVASQDVILHVHMYDPTRDALDHCANALKAMIGRSYILTSEKISDVWNGTANLFYASARFPRLYGFLTKYKLPYVVLDTDLIATGLLNQSLDYTKDVVLCRMPGRLPLHTQINASFSMFSGSVASIYFSEHVANFVSRVLMKEPVPWCLDQIALHCTLRNFEIEEIPMNAAACGPKIYNGTFSKDVLLWPQKCSLEHPERSKWQEVMRAV